MTTAESRSVICETLTKCGFDLSIAMKFCRFPTLKSLFLLDSNYFYEIRIFDTEKKLILRENSRKQVINLPPNHRGVWIQLDKHVNDEPRFANHKSATLIKLVDSKKSGEINITPAEALRTRQSPCRFEIKEHSDEGYTYFLTANGYTAPKSVYKDPPLFHFAR